MSHDSSTVKDVIYRPNKRLLRIFIVLCIILLLFIGQHLVFGSREDLVSEVQNNKVFRFINEAEDKDTLNNVNFYGTSVQTHSVQKQEEEQDVNGGQSANGINEASNSAGDEETGEMENMMDEEEDERERAAMVIVVQNKADILQVMPTIRSYQQKFNEKYNYDWVIISHRAMLSLLQQDITALTKPGSNVKFMDMKYLSELIIYPPGIDKQKVRQIRRDTKFPKLLRSKNVLQARHFARFLTGHFYNLDNIWKDYDYYWKVPLGSQLNCEVNYDVFKYMKQNKIKYGWLLMQEDYPHLHPSLFNAVKRYILDPNNDFMDESGPTRNNFHFLLGSGMDPAALQDPNADWKINSCSIDSEFELVDLSFFKSTQYQHFFNYIDGFNGFYYESWSESVIKTIVTSLFLNTNQVHFFDDLAVLVRTQALGLCPLNKDFYIKNKCTCNPQEHGKKIGVGKFPGEELQLMHKSTCLAKWLQSSGQGTPQAFEAEDDPLFESFLENDEPPSD